ncbi:MAG: hypothetical protein HFI37_09055 [Lachnospiraceae bacterium]|jgi:hypothetical protein|nr:hypothetical protein [Lachnospiraceae bacterium]
MRKRRRGKNFKFTEKKKSIKGAISCGGAILSLAVLAITLLQAVTANGNGANYLGSVGVAALFIGSASFIEAVQAVQEKDTFKTLPYTGMVLSAIATILWIALYFLGTLL